MNSLFSAVLSVGRDFRTFFSIKTKPGQIRLVVLVIIVIIGGILLRPETEPAEVSPPTVFPVVELKLVSDFSSGNSLQLIGAVSAVSEAEIITEVGGRVTAVPAVLGSSVRTGTVIARLENSAQAAALLQAEGAYEGALAAAQISGVSVSEATRGQQTANTDARNTLSSVLNTLDTAFYAQLDTIFADPQSTYRTPGSLGSDAPLLYALRDDYRYFESRLTAWNTKIAAATDTTAYVTLLDDMRADVNRMSDYINKFRILITADNVRSVSFDPTATTYLSTLGAVEAQLNAALSAITDAQNTIEQAVDTLDRARLGSAGGSSSAADAQIKQALGSLRAAQASYNKTIITAPISGTVTSLSVKTGQFVGSFAVIAKITNDTAYEITAFVTEDIVTTIALGDTVKINTDITGVISNISTAITSNAARREIKIQSTDPRLTSGESVRVTINNEVNEANQDTTSAISLPLTAIRFQGENAFVFSVSEDSTLVATPVTLENPSGANVFVIAGVTAEALIVVDARGLSAGQTVTIK